MARTQALATAFSKAIGETEGLHDVEIAYALAATMRGLGEVLYDKEDTSKEAVLEDYASSPSWAGALMIHADQIHVIRELFIRTKESNIDEGVETDSKETDE